MQKLERDGKLLKVLFLSLFVVLLDQVTKILVKGISIPALGINIQGMHYQQSIDVIGNFFKITYIENPGMAFGIQIGGKLFLSLFTIAATLLIVYFIYKNRKEPLYLRIALAFILGGAVGNLIDRTFYGVIYGYAPLFYGNVVDFFHIDTPNFELFGKHFYSWPIFNIADISVSFGFAMILFGYKKIAKPEEQQSQKQSNEQFPHHETENTFTTESQDTKLEPPPIDPNNNRQFST